ncbi:hypothetical protein O6H91_18G073000 [Diphasiastrum complanatum]|uniref:Uncharacterized protein n=6 Tax=Diphasiastrum complanatum TaxID=34168 RepID=A0ACC2B2M4_DIPCM|nr:hypothetical protein O6H91_18G073000 [Diphasiastrum complanatum]KAJ7524009.1 hypothetical protein O6H91_18G073000 [Diphasiastrum complanatum]KAJ7524010.1 hypothetical protein O6H91_18G073000 [Diphasiastrum complanatum]KAJ7524011.1 hypothetical protein O6H91_18G073000 [Diphasiastrum complanatum]KAJ7524012.1 hypothetical protein O6H91_18G073000 [Diphasiastrum complanatum]
MSAGGWGQPNGSEPPLHATPPLLQSRKHGIKGGIAPASQPWRMSKILERWGGRFFRLVSDRRTGLFAATLLAFLSLLMLINDVHLVSYHLKRFTSIPFRDGKKSLESAWKQPARDLISRVESWNLTHFSPNNTLENNLAPSIHTVSNDTFQNAGPSWKTSVSHQEGPHLQRHVGNFPPVLFSDSSLPFGHPCSTFRLPPPPADKKRTGPRPCPVCYLPVEAALREMAAPKVVASHVLKDLSYVHRQDAIEITKLVGGSDFGGHQTLEEREESFQLRESMHIYCGFTRGLRPGAGSGFDFDKIDQLHMDSCHGVVVASAIFGNYDILQQPKNVSKKAKNTVCFFMFVDEETAKFLSKAKFNETSRKIGLWRIVVVHNLPFLDARRNGKVPKLLIHRLFPNARFSLWVDGKLELVVDPYQILERFLWRSNDSFAVSKHYRRFDVYVEAEANKAARKYDNASIDAQVEFYRKQGLAPYSSLKLSIVSDVPEGCVIIREHTPITNLFGCLWFNEVDRFTSRDQLSFAIVRDKIMAQIPWRVNMFLDCERRNFVVQTYHKDLLKIMSKHKSSQEPPPSYRSPDTQAIDSHQPEKHHKVLPNKKKTGKEREGKGATF